MPSSSLATLKLFMCISEISKHCDLICIYFSVLIHVIHNEYTHTGASRGSPQMFYIILVRSTVLICDFVHFIPYACALGVMLYGIDIGADRSMPITLTPTPTHYQSHNQN